MLEESCNSCKHLVAIPFGCNICYCEDSEYYLCDVDPKEDLCRYYEKKEKGD